MHHAACYHRDHGPARHGALARHRRSRGDQDIPLGMAASSRDRGPARRDPGRPAWHHRGSAGSQRRGEDHVPLDPRHVARSRRRAGAGPRPGRDARRRGAAPADQHGQRPSLVPVEPEGRRDHRVLRAPLRPVGRGPAAARGHVDRAVRAQRLSTRPLQRALDGPQAARGPGQGARQRAGAALPGRANAGPRPRRVGPSPPAHRRSAPGPRRDDRADDALHAGSRGAVRRDRLHQGRAHPGPRHRRRAEAADRPRRRDRAEARSAAPRLAGRGTRRPSRGAERRLAGTDGGRGREAAARPATGVAVGGRRRAQHPGPRAGPRGRLR